MNSGPPPPYQPEQQQQQQGFQSHIDKDADYRKQYGLYPDPDPSYQASQPYQPSSSQMQYASPLPQPGAYVAQTNYVWVFSDHPMQLVCPHCQAQIITRIKYQSGAATWLLSLGICLFGCWLGCYLIPFCVNGTKNVSHFCPNCNQFLGEFKRI